MAEMELSNRQMAKALMGQSVELPWPSEYLGVYGSHRFDGSPTTPQGEQGAMERWVAEHILLPQGTYLRSVAAGRRRDGTPVLVLDLDTCALVGVACAGQHTPSYGLTVRLR